MTKLHYQLYGNVDLHMNLCALLYVKNLINHEYNEIIKNRKKN
jgi:hypothetical protein